jgi:hypothetical protein
MASLASVKFLPQLIPNPTVERVMADQYTKTTYLSKLDISETKGPNHVFPSKPWSLIREYMQHAEKCVQVKGTKDKQGYASIVL